jgi:membrane protein DedA with SNARE-associated domain
MIAAIQGFLSSAGVWALVPIFLVVTLESSAFLGLLFPGEMVALIAGALAATQAFSPWSAFATVASAAVFGDIAGYALGRYWGQAVLARWSFARRQYDRHRRRLESYFEVWGIATVLIGRFIAVGRAFVPFAAGLSEMPAHRFMPMAVFAGVLWGGAVVALGYVLGSNWRLVERWMRSLGAGILILSGLTILTVLLWRWLAGRQNEITAAWQRRAQRYGIDLAPFVEFIRARLSPTGYLGLHFTVGLIALVALAWLFGGVTQDIFAQDPLVAVDQRVARFIAQHHTSALDSVASAIAFFSNSWWMLFLVAVAAFGWALAGDLTRSITAAAVLGGAYGLALGLQSVFSTFSPHVPQPDLVHGFMGFPSVTLTAATAAYGVACYSFAVQSRSWRLQTLSAVSALYIVFLIGLSAIYAGEPLSAAIGGFALGGFWLAICLTGGLTFDRLRSSNHPTSLGQRGC